MLCKVVVADQREEEHGGSRFASFIFRLLRRFESRYSTVPDALRLLRTFLASPKSAQSSSRFLLCFLPPTSSRRSPKISSTCHPLQDHERIVQVLARHVSIRTPQITRGAIWQIQRRVLVTEAAIETVPSTIESVTGKMTIADDLIALDTIAISIEKIVRTANGSIVTERGMRMKNIQTRGDLDTMTVTGSTEAIDHQNAAKRPKNAGFAKPQSAKRSSSSSRTAFLTKNQVQLSERPSQNS